MTFRFTSAALAERREASLQYEAKEKELGARFFAEVDQAVGRILAAPEAWRRLSQRTRPFQLLPPRRGGNLQRPFAEALCILRALR